LSTFLGGGGRAWQYSSCYTFSSIRGLCPPNKVKEYIVNQETVHHTQFYGNGGGSHDDSDDNDDDNEDDDWLREPLMLKLILIMMITFE
jgi:hypothetical protein